jgi:hypothetical protein
VENEKTAKTSDDDDSNKRERGRVRRREVGRGSSELARLSLRLLPSFLGLGVLGGEEFGVDVGEDSTCVLSHRSVRV